MSRVPRTAKSSSSLRGQYRASNASPIKTLPDTPSKLRVPRATSSKLASHSPSTSSAADGKTSPTKERLSLKEQIALKRAEVKKAQLQTSSGNSDDFFGADVAATPAKGKKDDDDIVELGRWSVRETIERARNTGNLNLSARSLVCIPSCLFEIHLGIKPSPLRSVTEPDYAEEDTPRRVRQNRQQPSWFEAQDLMVLKARTNEIVELQPELSLFGSLKTLDLHSNLLRSLPASLTLLSLLTVLDVSNNKLTEIPPPIFSLPSLTTLDISHNELTSLPFSQFGAPLDLPSTLAGEGSFFQPEVQRANTPLPKLHNLNASHNKLSSNAIDHEYLPAELIQLNLAHNPLGDSVSLLSAISRLKSLQELHLEDADIADESFEGRANKGFSSLRLLDLGETRVTEQAIHSFFSGSPRERSLNFHISTAPPSPGELRVVVGKRVVKEQWEIEAEQRYLRKKKSFMAVKANSEQSGGGDQTTSHAEVIKEPWEVEAEEGLLTEGGRRRARAAAAATAKASSPPPVPKIATRPKVVEKEAWEIEAEKGLLTEGARRRLRAQQAASTSSTPDSKKSEPVELSSSPSSLANSTYYSSKDQSLTLPPSSAPSRGHARAFSLAITAQSQSKPQDLLVPTPTFPLNVIARQNFASTLRVLTLKNRRADPTFAFPPASIIAEAASSGGVLPRLDELYLEGCSLGDTVNVSHESEESSRSSTPQKRSLLDIIATLFPSLTVLDLSYNAISSDAFTDDVLRKLLFASSEDVTRRGLKALRLRGNSLNDLDGFDSVAALFKGNRQVPEWRLEELDVRDNNISKLPVNLGLLPLDVFLVDGNTFRVPPRKVWEREGTKGLLSWLRGRIE